MISDQSSPQIQGYRLPRSLHHRELAPFVSEFIFKRNIFTIGYLLLNLLFLVLLLVSGGFFISSTIGTTGKAFEYFGYGCAITFLLIPFHELLHGLAYKLCGAKQVAFRANWRKLYFMAVADKFVTTAKQFYFIALLPVTCISVISIILAWYTEDALPIMWLTVALVHASMCAGDFGLLSFFAEYGKKDIVTFDDVEKEISYFYEKEE